MAREGVVVKTGDAPQASVGISWRDAADNLICLMIIRWERGKIKVRGERREGEREEERDHQRDPHFARQR